MLIWSAGPPLGRTTLINPGDGRCPAAIWLQTRSPRTSRRHLPPYWFSHFGDKRWNVCWGSTASVESLRSSGRFQTVAFLVFLWFGWNSKFHFWKAVSGSDCGTNWAVALTAGGIIRVPPQPHMTAAEGSKQTNNPAFSLPQRNDLYWLVETDTLSIWCFLLLLHFCCIRTWFCGIFLQFLC